MTGNLLPSLNPATFSSKNTYYIRTRLRYLYQLYHLIHCSISSIIKHCCHAIWNESGSQTSYIIPTCVPQSTAHFITTLATTTHSYLTTTACLSDGCIATPNHFNFTLRILTQCLDTLSLRQVSDNTGPIEGNYNRVLISLMMIIPTRSIKLI